MDRGDAAVRYFGRVYPRLRGAHAPDLGAMLTRRLTEPGAGGRLDWVLGELAGLEPQRILDAGCGIGTYTVALARRGHQVTALDLSPLMLRATRRAAESADVADRVATVEADLRAWRPEARFDTVLCMGVAEYYPDAAVLFQRLFAWARQRLLISASREDDGLRSRVRRAWLGCHGVRARLFSASVLARALDRLPLAEVRVREMPWAHCASAAHRPRHPARLAPVRPRDDAKLHPRRATCLES